MANERNRTPDTAPMDPAFDLSRWEIDKFRKEKEDEVALWKSPEMQRWWRFVPNKAMKFRTVDRSEMLTMLTPAETLRLIDLCRAPIKAIDIARELLIPVHLVTWYRKKKVKRDNQLDRIEQRREERGRTDQRLKALLDGTIAEMERRLLDSTTRSNMDMAELVKSAKELAMMLQRVQAGDLDAQGDGTTIKLVSNMPKKSAVKPEEPDLRPLSDDEGIHSHRLN